jgi:hypothetical protein
MNPVNLTFPLLPARNLPPKGTAGTKRGIFGSLRVRLPLEPGQKGDGPPFPRQALFQTSAFPDKCFSRQVLFQTGAFPDRRFSRQALVQTGARPDRRLSRQAHRPAVLRTSKETGAASVGQVWLSTGACRAIVQSQPNCQISKSTLTKTNAASSAWIRSFEAA